MTTEWPEDCPPSRLELIFKKVKEGTEISMTYSVVPLEQADDIAEGWIDFYWEPLKEYLKK